VAPVRRLTVERNMLIAQESFRCDICVIWPTNFMDINEELMDRPHLSALPMPTYLYLLMKNDDSSVHKECGSNPVAFRVSCFAHMRKRYPFFVSPTSMAHSGPMGLGCSSALSTAVKVASVTSSNSGQGMSGGPPSAMVLINAWNCTSWPLS
jgi:hypothetical protein